jgi:hypothetical protein
MHLEEQRGGWPLTLAWSLGKCALFGQFVKIPCFMKLENSPPCSQKLIDRNSPEPLYSSSRFISVITRSNFSLCFVVYFTALVVPRPCSNEW